MINKSTLIADVDPNHVLFEKLEPPHDFADITLISESMLKNRYGNPQVIVSAHMSTLAKLSKVENNNLHG